MDLEIILKDEYSDGALVHFAISRIKESEREKNYKVKERFIDLLKKYRCVEKILSTLKAELKSYEDSWSGYSSDCLGHAIIFNQLMIGFIERNFNQPHDKATV